jgi:hypothetical protein
MGSGRDQFDESFGGKDLQGFAQGRPRYAKPFAELLFVDALTRREFVMDNEFPQPLRQLLVERWPH